MLTESVADALAAQIGPDEHSQLRFPGSVPAASPELLRSWWYDGAPEIFGRIDASQDLSSRQATEQR